MLEVPLGAISLPAINNQGKAFQKGLGELLEMQMWVWSWDLGWLIINDLLYIAY